MDAMEDESWDVSIQHHYRNVPSVPREESVYLVWLKQRLGTEQMEPIWDGLAGLPVPLRKWN